MKNLYLLKRTISPYTGEDLFLGIYDNIDLANKQKQRYINNCKIKDEWEEQAYRDVDLEKDLEIIDVADKLSEPNFPNEGQSIYLVSGIDEGFGQIVKKLIFISLDESKVKAFIKEKDEEAEEEWEENDFMYYKWGRLKLNVLFFGVD